jgi:hypothetical protein
LVAFHINQSIAQIEKYKEADYESDPTQNIGNRRSGDGYGCGAPRVC